MENTAKNPLESLAEWGGSATGMLGAVLVSAQCSFSGWGYLVWLVSNCLLVTFSLYKGARGLLLMQVFFTLTSLQGVLNSFYDGIATRTLLLAWHAFSDVFSRVAEILAIVLHV